MAPSTKTTSTTTSRTSTILSTISNIGINIFGKRVVHVITQILFTVTTAFLTYLNGPWYSLQEVYRNYEIFGYRKIDYEKEFPGSLDGKVCVMTGGTRGIGLEVVRFLLSKGCTVITGSSSLTELSSEIEVNLLKSGILKDIGRDENFNYGGLSEKLVVLPLDLASMSSVYEFTDEVHRRVERIDFLLCNGGVMFVPFDQTGNGFEMHMAINYYSHCLLILKCLPLLAGAQQSRVVVVSSGAHHASLGIRFHDLNSSSLFSVYHSYAQSKLSLIMFTYRLNSWLREHNKSNITINCLHPGVCRTSLMTNFNFFKLQAIQDLPLFRSAKDGAETLLYATLSPEIAGLSGVYLENCSSAKSSSISYRSDLQDTLWRRTWSDLSPWLTSQDERELGL